VYTVSRVRLADSTCKLQHQIGRSDACSVVFLHCSTCILHTAFNNNRTLSIWKSVLTLMFIIGLLFVSDSSLCFVRGHYFSWQQFEFASTPCLCSDAAPTSLPYRSPCVASKSDSPLFAGPSFGGFAVSSDFGGLVRGERVG